VSILPPGTLVTVSAAALPGASSASTGAWFVTGLTQRGPTGVPVLLTSLNDYTTLLGTRQSYSPLYDAAELYFASGGSTMWVSRVVGPAATVASVTLNDSSAHPTLTVKANGAGVYGNSITISVIAGPVTGSFVIQVSYAGAIVETSPALVTTTDAVNWGTLNPVTSQSPASKWVTITDLGQGTQPALISNAAMSGGADDNTNAGDTQFTAALTIFTPEMGPGQVSAPGRTTAAAYTALLNHAQANNRMALLDAVNLATAASTVTAAQGAQSSATDPSYGTMLAPWISWPGLPTGSPVPTWPRQVPPSAAAAALMSANDAANDANVAAAGDNGIVDQALGVTQTFVAADRASLNAAGVSVFRAINGLVKLYGYQSLASDPRWQDLANCRFRMQLVHDAQLVGDSFYGSQIDGQGKVISAFNGALTAILAGYYAKGSLYGATPAQAYSVNTGPTVNTPTTITARQLNAIESVVMSPSAEMVDIAITKYLVDQPIQS
jgi:hypothetical protein